MNSNTPMEGQTPRPESSVSYLPRVAKGAMINLTGAMIRTVLVYAYTMLLARALLTEELGQFYLMYTVANILGLVAAIGLDFGVVRYVALYAGENKFRAARMTLWAALSLSIPVAAVIVIGGTFAAPYFSEVMLGGSDAATMGLVIFLVSIPFWVLARLCNSATQGLHRMQYQVISRDFGEQLSKFTFSIIAVAVGAGLMGIVWANLASVIVAALLSLFFVLLVFRQFPKDHTPHEKTASTLYRYSLPLAFSNIIGIILIWSDTLLLGYLGSASDVGLYGVALRMGSTFSITIIMAFITVFQPVISDLFNRHQNHELQALYKTVTRWMLICSYPLFLVLALFAEPVMSIFGSEFAAGSSALILLALGQLINAGMGSAGIMVVMSGRSQMELFNVGAALIADVVLCILLIPSYGLVGAAFANMASMGVVNLMRMTEVWIFMRIHAYNKKTMKPIIAGTVSALIAVGASRLPGMGSGIVPALVLIAGLLAVYALMTLLLGLDEDDRAVLRMARSRLARGAGAA